jgi:N utilization substance protein A
MQWDLNRVVEQVGRDKGIDKAVIIEALESAMLVAAKRKFGPEKEIEAQYNEEIGEVELFQFLTVVDSVADIDLEVMLDEAIKDDPEIEVGDSIGLKMETTDFGRIAAQTAKQVIIQKVREAERRLILDEFNDRIGDLVNGSVRRFERGNIIVDLGRTLAVVPRSEQIPNEHYNQGDRITCLLLDVKDSAKGPQLVLSRSHPDMLIRIFEMEVPEIFEGIVQIKGCVRDVGYRAKIAVYSTSTDVDPVGACVGMRGSRVQNVVKELNGEKIDIVVWTPDDATFVNNALAPAQVSKIFISEDTKSMEIVVPDDQLSLAIGRNGQNVRLASQLSHWKLDILSEDKASELKQKAMSSLMKIEGVMDTEALALYQAGYRSFLDICELEPSEIEELPGLNPKRAAEIIEKSNDIEPSDEEIQEVLAEEVSTKVLPSDSIKELKGINERLSRAMKDVGIDTIEEAKGYSVDELCAKLNISQDEALDFIDLVLDYEEAKEREED